MVVIIDIASRMFLFTFVLLAFIKDFHMLEMHSMKAALAPEPGGPDKIIISNEKIPEPRAGQMLIKVVKSAINRADILQRMGKYPVPAGSTSVLGLEACGRVFKVLEGSKFALGERVMTLLSGGGNAEFVVAEEAHTMRVPDSLEWSQAAAIPEVWLTAYQVLHTVGQLAAEDVVLVHAAASGVGTAAIQMIASAGATAIASTGSQSKGKFCRQLGASHVIDRKQEDIAERVLEYTEGKGVSLVMDCVGGSMVDHNLKSLAVDGRWVLYGTMGGPNVDGPFLGQILRKRISVLPTTLRSRSFEYKKQLVANFSAKILPGLASGNLNPVIDREFPLKELSQAHAYMESNANIGKILINVSGDDGTASKREL